MKTLVILFADCRATHILEEIKPGFSSFDFALEWAENTKAEKIYVLSYEPNSSIENEKAFLENYRKVESFVSKKSLPFFKLASTSVASLFKAMEEILTKENADNCIFSFADLPFLNSALTEELFFTHTEYKAEYTFADGYPYGFTPEILDAGTVRILSKLSEDTRKKEGESIITRTSIFDFIKLDINSFEVETAVSEYDYSLLRLSFSCEGKLEYLCSKALFEAVSENKRGSGEREIHVGEAYERAKNSGEKKLFALEKDELLKATVNTPQVYKTVPSYYNLQLTTKWNCIPIYDPEEMIMPEDKSMPIEKVEMLLKKISDFSGKAVISTGFFGESLLYKDFIPFVRALYSHPGLSLLVETDGLSVTEELCQKLREISDSILWIVRLDAESEAQYAELRKFSLNWKEFRDENGVSLFDRAKASVSLLEKYFPGKVYPQFVRMNENEPELEAFWRYWNDSSNGSGGRVLIQKYSSFCKTLPERKSADLSPLERNACYHLRRDFSILVDGSVPPCKEMLSDKIIGNAFTEELNEIFKKSDEEFINHLKCSYCEKCRNCDEYYTFNF